jgi:L-ascorbate metabolism protein UlaG (beta-lactamase superfamily)
VTARYFLRDTVRIDLSYRDDTAWGSAVSGRIDRLIVGMAGKAFRGSNGQARDFLTSAQDSLRRLCQPGALGDLYLRPGVLRSECLYPDEQLVRPRSLVVSASQADVASELPLGELAPRELAGFFVDLRHGMPAPSSAGARALWQGLLNAGALTPAEPEPAVSAGDQPVTFVGHATVLLRDEATRLLIDPLFVADQADLRDRYAPVVPWRVGADAVLITHSHGDHYDPSTLLRFGPDIRLIVPYVARESLLALDLAYRLRELGFRNVTALRWGEETSVGGFRIVALPFYGEQPTTEHSHHPEVRNAGNVYLVEGRHGRYAFTADSGRDGAGDVRSVAREARQSFGPLDILFAGFRNWSLYPVQYLNPVFARYFLFVPPSEWTVRQSIMNDADAALDTAEAWNAGVVVPYANGGAAWYHRRLIGPAPEGRGNLDDPFDPYPELVADRCERRSMVGATAIGSPVRVVLARPGDGLVGKGRDTAVARKAPHAWPYDERRRRPAGAPPHEALHG